MSDLVSGLLVKLDSLEQAARAVEPLGHNFDMGGNRQDEKFTHARIVYASEDGRARTEWGDEPEHFGNWEPEAVLRLCRAHRAIVGEYQRLKDELDDARDTHPDLANFVALGTQVRTLKAVLGALARGR